MNFLYQMRKIYVLAFLLVLILSCSKSELKNGGYFFAQNNDLFYAIHINSNLDTIKLFILNEYSSYDSEEVVESRKNFKNFRNGLIKVNGNKISISELESDIVPTERPILKDLVYRNGKIYADCKNLHKSFFGDLFLSFCSSESIVFKRMKK